MELADNYRLRIVNAKSSSLRAVSPIQVLSHPPIPPHDSIKSNIRALPARVPNVAGIYLRNLFS